MAYQPTSAESDFESTIVFRKLDDTYMPISSKPPSLFNGVAFKEAENMSSGDGRQKLPDICDSLDSQKGKNQSELPLWNLSIECTMRHNLL